MVESKVTFELPFFDVTLLHQPSLMMIVGNPGSGKTNTVRSLLVELAYDAAVNRRPDFPLIHTAMYGSKGEGEYGDAIHPAVVFDDVQAETLKNTINRLLRIRQDAVTDPDNVDREDMGTRIVMDDVTSSRNIFENKYARFAWRKNRHVDLSVWLCSQYVNDAPAWMRQLFSVVFIRSVNNSDRQQLFKNYGQFFKDYNAFTQILSETTKVVGRSLVLYLRAPQNPIRKGAIPAVSYYDAIDPARSDALLGSIRLTHPDILADLERRGDPTKYDEMEPL